MPITNWLPGPFQGMVRRPRPGPGGMDLGGVDDIPRLVGAPGSTPSRLTMEGVQAFIPLQNAFTVAMAIGKRPSGPGVGTPISNPGQVAFPQYFTNGGGK